MLHCVKTFWETSETFILTLLLKARFVSSLGGESLTHWTIQISIFHFTPGAGDLEITNTNGCWYHPRYSGHYHVTSGHHHFISGHPQLAPTVVANYFSSKTFLHQRSQQTFQQTQLVEHFISCCKLYSYQIWSAHNRSNLCPRQSLVFLIHSYWWVKDKSIHQRKATLPFQGNFAISRLLCHF